MLLTAKVVTQDFCRRRFARPSRGRFSPVMPSAPPHPEYHHLRRDLGLVDLMALIRRPVRLGGKVRCTIFRDMPEKRRSRSRYQRSLSDA